MSSERTPLLPTSRSDLPSASQVQSTAEDAAQSVKQASFKLAPALAALKAGKLPSQEQLEKLLDNALDSDVLSPGIGKAGSRTGRLSEEGARVIKALRKVLQAAEQLGHEKNGAFLSSPLCPAPPPSGLLAFPARPAPPFHFVIPSSSHLLGSNCVRNLEASH